MISLVAFMSRLNRRRLRPAHRFRRDRPLGALEDRRDAHAAGRADRDQATPRALRQQFGQHTDDAGHAARRLMTDDGYNLGVLYAGQRNPYPARVAQGAVGVTELESEFEL